MTQKIFDRRILAHDIVGDTDVYFSAMKANGLYVYNRNKGTTTCLGVFPGEENTRHLHGASVIYENEIYFAPANGNNISVYDLKTNSFLTIPVSSCDSDARSKYFDAHEWNGMIYFIPARARNLLVMNPQNHEVKAFDGWMDLINKDAKGNAPLVKKGSFFANGHIFMPLGREGALISIDVETFECEKIMIEGISTGIVDAKYCEEEDCLWLLLAGCGTVAKTNLKGRNTQVFEPDMIQADKRYEYPYLFMVDMGQTLVIPSYQAMWSYSFDKQTGKFTKIDLGEVDELKQINWFAAHFFAKKIAKDRFVTASTKDNMFEVYDANAQKIETWTCLGEARVFNESTEVGLKDFLDYLKG